MNLTLIITFVRYQYDQVLDGRACGSGTLALDRDVTGKIPCAILCTTSANCKSWFYNAETGRCQGCTDMHFFAGTLPTEDGTKYFRLVLDCASSEYLVSGPEGVPDDALSSSSAYGVFEQPELHSPNWSRLDTIETESGNGAWSSAILDKQQWIQARFLTTKIVTGMAIQGRDLSHDPSNQPRQYVTEFMISYSTDCFTFQTVSDSNGTSLLFAGNTDANTIVTQMLPTPVYAACVRLNPTKWYAYISLRWDIIGC